MNSTKQRIFLGIAEILAGEKHGDVARGAGGQEMIEAVFDNLPDNIRDAYNHINMGIAEIEVGTRVGDADRVGWGYSVVDDALLALNGLRADGADARMELHRAGVKLWEIADSHLAFTGDYGRYLRARERFQIALSKIAGGNRLKGGAK